MAHVGRRWLLRVLAGAGSSGWGVDRIILIRDKPLKSLLLLLPTAANHAVLICLLIIHVNSTFNINK